ncbi:MAG: cysteine--tRNA ligase [Chloroflexi bacterium]|nr:cysteine--tRNA ligase [Chloroflexota bacterium]
MTVQPPFQPAPVQPTAMVLRIYNTLTRQVEPVVPLTPSLVRMYTCGPTVYRSVHIGNLRSYLLADWLRRVFLHLGLSVTHVKNITDVGHMRQEVLERGEDKIIAAALAAGKTPAEIAAHYAAGWQADEAALNILRATVTPRATEHVADMIQIIERLLRRGHAYEVNGTIYYDVSSFPAYGRLSGNQLSSLLKGVRVEADPNKRQPADFTLWKRAEPGRMLKWTSPWGDGFPGWHIECSAMSMRYLGESFDVHTGGVDNVFPHHEDEIAQSEGATGQPFVRYWVHGQHLLADGLKMAKSTGNAYTLADLRDRGFAPLAFRYLCLLTHYRSRLNFTFASLRAAGKALARIEDAVRSWDTLPRPTESTAMRQWNSRFWAYVLDDLNLPAAAGTLWQMLRAPDLSPAERRELLLQWDDILGLGLDAVQPFEQSSLPSDVRYTVQARERARYDRDYSTADELRQVLQLHGYALRDHRTTTEVRPALPEGPLRYSRPADVPSLLDEPDCYDVSLCLLVHNYHADVERCLRSFQAYEGRWRIEYVIVENASTDGTALWLEEFATHRDNVTLLRADHRLGEADGRNLALRQARGHVVALVDTGVEATGDCFTPLLKELSQPRVGAAGRWGFRTHDLRHFEETSERTVDGIAGYFFAFRRADLRRTGWLDSKYRYYRNLDLHFSFQFLAQGLDLVARPDLPLVMHEHRGWEELSEEERDKRSKRNFYRFLNAWHHREELTVDHRRPTSQR